MQSPAELRKRSSVTVAHGTTAGLALHAFQVEAEVKQRIGGGGRERIGKSTISIAYDLLQEVINSSVRLDCFLVLLASACASWGVLFDEWG